MNYLQLCEFVANEADNVRWKMTSVSDPDASELEAKIVRWVAQAYRDIQRWSRYFSFHLREGVLVRTEAGRSDYRKAGVRELLPGSLNARRKGSTTTWPIMELLYRDWLWKYGRYDLTQGIPVDLTEVRNGVFRVSPVPDGEYEILGAWYMTIDELVRDEDEPLWDEESHDIVAWQALKYYTSEYEVSELLAQRVQEALTQGKKEFLMRYLPDISLCV